MYCTNDHLVTNDHSMLTTFTTPKVELRSHLSNYIKMNRMNVQSMVHYFTFNQNPYYTAHVTRMTTNIEMQSNKSDDFMHLQHADHMNRDSDDVPLCVLLAQPQYLNRHEAGW